AGPIGIMAAALHLQAIGVERAVVTNGGKMAASTSADGVHSAMPPAVEVKHVTGAGDAFMAAHIAAELRGLMGAAALKAALDGAAAHVAGEV
ncbi:MAG: PfkB family carbohydrate kinase, partial [Pseudomonadota bacterium]